MAEDQGRESAGRAWEPLGDTDPWDVGRRPHVRIFINGTIASKLTASVGDTDEVLILQALSGR